MKLCKLLFLGLLGMASAALSGCESIPVDKWIKASMTPEVTICDGLEGKPLAEAEQVLGGPSEIKRQGPEQRRRYKRGFFEGELTIVDGNITAVDCRKN